jgi:hypothetical protein
MPRPRFSLCGLLLLTAAVAIVCWYRDLPRQNANRFANLIEAGECAAAEDMFDDAPLELCAGKSDVDLLGQSLADWLRGRYPIRVELHASDWYYSVLIDATARGLDSGNTSVTVTASP